MAHSYTLSAWVVEAKGSGIEGQSWLHFKFKLRAVRGTCDSVSKNPIQQDPPEHPEIQTHKFCVYLLFRSVRVRGKSLYI